MLNLIPEERMKVKGRKVIKEEIVRINVDKKIRHKRKRISFLDESIPADDERKTKEITKIPPVVKINSTNNMVDDELLKENEGKLYRWRKDELNKQKDVRLRIMEDLGRSATWLFNNIRNPPFFHVIKIGTAIEG